MSNSPSASDKRFLSHRQAVTLYLVVSDFLALHLAYFLALWVRFDCVYSRIPLYYLNVYLRFITAYTVGAVLIFRAFRMYRSMLRYSSYPELTRTVTASLLTSILHIVLITALFHRMPISYYLGGLILQIVFVIIIRFSFRHVTAGPPRQAAVSYQLSAAYY